MDQKILKRVIRIGPSRAVVIPPKLLSDDVAYIWLRKEDGRIVIEPAEVR
ncbi:MAG: hypothetical protein NZ938_00360 [Aigarchaeota archaeon]|nr:hypothetical protein [Candidatus Calditenuaceae archaeon]